MSIEAPLARHREVVRPEWIDYNGHMNVAYYVLVFDHATDCFFDYVGLDETYRQERGGTTFAVDSRVSYIREVQEGDSLRVETQFLGFDDKRLHFFHRMHHETDGFLAATSEWLALHIDLAGTRRTTPFPDDIRQRLEEVWEAHRRLERPEQVDRPIRAPKMETSA